MAVGFIAKRWEQMDQLGDRSQDRESNEPPSPNPGKVTPGLMPCPYKFQMSKDMAQSPRGLSISRLEHLKWSIHVIPKLTHSYPPTWDSLELTQEEGMATEKIIFPFYILHKGNKKLSKPELL